ncbi:MAG TPA: TadE/TadG family type IV pilus assembly protein [Candidatus Solibacter sp.]|nr:TadE/TadG family type IV pilus assembly protein [Candidatus Solibacter sp.]
MKRNHIPRAAKKIVGTLARDTHGQEIAEAAAVLPLMFMVLLGIFWFGQAFSIYGTITRAAQEGATAASQQTCTTCPAGQTRSQNAFNTIQTVMSASNLSTGNLQNPAVAIPSLTSCTSLSAPVDCDNANTGVCVQEGVALSSNVQTGGNTAGAGVCGVSVHFQYRYQFWLPFASLNKQTILINASAQAPMETR